MRKFAEHKVSEEQRELLVKIKNWMTMHPSSGRSLITNTLQCGTYGDVHTKRLNEIRKLYLNRNETGNN